MKYLKKVIGLLFMIVIVSGCVKVETNMKISKNKKMDFEIIMALDKSMLEEENIYRDELLDDKQKEELINKGFEIKPYTEGNKIGNIITKKFDNIDYLSSDSDVEFDLENVIEDDLSTAYIFKIEKKFLANKYYAKYDFDLIDINFKVTLPYKALDSNATSIDNDGKLLIWDLQKTHEPIEFTFELYNIQNVLAVFLVILIFVLIFIYCILAIIKKISERKGKNNDKKKIKKVKQNKVRLSNDGPRFIIPQNQDNTNENN